ncbi:hypothetical protein M433DRAFT_344518 [Acidomyces richmondensis BFW]|nr:MAG: hypothetical protein FE78DRAFT_527784 [Acidomyces sp. 'richmondensis']KYG50507.1 hypothetical protein M433DRAFT_344518 [Acidomyces richmondensis BFW]
MMVLQYALCCRKPTRLAEDEVPAGTYDCHHHVNNMTAVLIGNFCGYVPYQSQNPPPTARDLPGQSIIILSIIYFYCAQMIGDANELQLIRASLRLYKRELLHS